MNSSRFYPVLTAPEDNIPKDVKILSLLSDSRCEIYIAITLLGKNHIIREQLSHTIKMWSRVSRPSVADVSGDREGWSPDRGVEI